MSFSETKSRTIFYCDDSGDVIHRTFEIFLSYLKIARGILPIPEILKARDVIIGRNLPWILFPKMTLGENPNFWILFPRFANMG